MKPPKNLHLLHIKLIFTMHTTNNNICILIGLVICWIQLWVRQWHVCGFYEQRFWPLFKTFLFSGQFLKGLFSMMIFHWFLTWFLFKVGTYVWKTNYFTICHTTGQTYTWYVCKIIQMELKLVSKGFNIFLNPGSM